MGGSITLRNGYCWAGSGWEFRAIVRELEHYLDPDSDRKILDRLHNPEGAAQAVELIDLSDHETWSDTEAKRVENAMTEAHRRVVRTGEWKSQGLRKDVQTVLSKTLEHICGAGLRDSDET